MPSPLSVPADRLAPLGTPLTTTDNVSEPSVSVSAEEMSRSIAASSNPAASAADRVGASVTAVTAMVCSASVADHSSPSKAENRTLVVPLQSSVGSKVSEPESIRALSMTWPWVTATPSSSRLPLAGRASMRMDSTASPVSSSSVLKTMVATPSSAMVTEPDCTIGASLMPSMCTVMVAVVVVV